MDNSCAADAIHSVGIEQDSIHISLEALGGRNRRFVDYADSLDKGNVGDRLPNSAYFFDGDFVVKLDCRRRNRFMELKHLLGSHEMSDENRADEHRHRSEQIRSPLRL